MISLKSMVFALVASMAFLSSQASFGISTGVVIPPNPEKLRRQLNPVIFLKKGDLKLSIATSSRHGYPAFFVGEVDGYLNFILKDDQLSLHRWREYLFLPMIQKIKMRKYLEEKKLALEKILDEVFKLHQDGVYFNWIEFSVFLPAFFATHDHLFEKRFTEFFRDPNDATKPLCIELVSALKP